MNRPATDPHPMATCGLALLLALTLPGCGDDDGAGDRDAGPGRVDAGADDGGPRPTDAGRSDASADSGAGPDFGLDVRAVGSTAEDLGSSGLSTVKGQLSGDGSCYVFESASTGVARSGDIGRQVYVLDVSSNEIDLVSVDDAGAPAASAARLPLSLFGHYVSDDCRYVIFSTSSPLSSEAGDDESYQGSRVYVRDRTTGTTELISFIPGPGNTSGCETGSLSGDGTQAVFRCNIEGRNNSFVNPWELYLWSREEGTARYLDVKRIDGGDLDPAFDAGLAFLAANGRYVIAEAGGRPLGLPDGRTWIRIDSSDDSWVELPLQDPAVTDSLGFPSMATDGDATELLYITINQVLAETDPVGAHLYVLDIETGTRTLITGEAPGMPTNRVGADHVRLTPDGRYAVLQLDDLGFAGGETDFARRAAVLWDRETSEWTVLSRRLRTDEMFLGQPFLGGQPSLSADGSTAIFRCFEETSIVPAPPNWTGLCLWRAP